MEEESNVSSKYNEAINQITRLHNIWLSCAASKEQGNITKYEILLRNAESELKYDIKLLSDGLEENHESNYMTKVKKNNIQIRQSNNFILKTSLEETKVFQSAAISMKWSLLIQKEELLREIQEEAGKGGVRINPAEDDEID